MPLHAVPRRALFNQETGILGLDWAHMALSAVWTAVAIKQVFAFFCVILPMYHSEASRPDTLFRFQNQISPPDVWKHRFVHPSEQ